VPLVGVRRVRRSRSQVRRAVSAERHASLLATTVRRSAFSVSLIAPLRLVRSVWPWMRGWTHTYTASAFSWPQDRVT
jgi:hypothetical protein